MIPSLNPRNVGGTETGGAVPEPATLTLAGLGLAALRFNRCVKSK